MIGSVCSLRSLNHRLLSKRFHKSPTNVDPPAEGPKTRPSTAASSAASSSSISASSAHQTPNHALDKAMQKLISLYGPTACQDSLLRCCNALGEVVLTDKKVKEHSKQGNAEFTAPPELEACSSSSSSMDHDDDDATWKTGYQTSDYSNNLQRHSAVPSHTDEEDDETWLLMETMFAQSTQGSVGLFLVNEEGLILRTNPAAVQMFLGDRQQLHATNDSVSPLLQQSIFPYLVLTDHLQEDDEISHVDTSRKDASLMLQRLQQTRYAQRVNGSRFPVHVGIQVLSGLTPSSTKYVSKDDDGFPQSPAPQQQKGKLFVLYCHDLSENGTAMTDSNRGHKKNAPAFDQDETDAALPSTRPSLPTSNHSWDTATFLQNLLEIHWDAALITNQEGVIQYANRMAKTLLVTTTSPPDGDHGSSSLTQQPLSEWIQILGEGEKNVFSKNDLRGKQRRRLRGRRVQQPEEKSDSNNNLEVILDMGMQSIQVQRDVNSQIAPNDDDVSGKDYWWIIYCRPLLAPMILKDHDDIGDTTEAPSSYPSSTSTETATTTTSLHDGPRPIWNGMAMASHDATSVGSLETTPAPTSSSSTTCYGIVDVLPRHSSASSVGSSRTRHRFL